MEKREMLMEVAERLGYRPNAAAALLSRRVAAGRVMGRVKGRVKARLSVVYLSAVAPDRTSFLKVCQELGFDGRWENPGAFRNPLEAARVLWNRGVDGVVVSSFAFPWDQKQRAKFDWGKFSVVKLDRAWMDVPCHLVRHSPFDHMARTLNEVIARGYRRIAVVLRRSVAPADDDARFGAILNIQHRALPAGVRLDWRDLPFREQFVVEQAELAWLVRCRPDVVVFFHQAHAEQFLQKRPKELRGVAVAAVFVGSNEGENPLGISGCDFQAVETWRRALRLLQGLMGRGERGFASHPLEDVIEPEWVPGRTG